jgi:hypothetical protein
MGKEYGRKEVAEKGMDEIWRNGKISVKKKEEKERQKE